MRGNHPPLYDLSEYDLYLDRIHRAGERHEDAPNADLASAIEDLRKSVKAGASLGDVLPDTFAITRIAAERSLGLRPYDVQVIAAIALHQGKLVEMQTGEGKTLAAVLPAALRALRGEGVHILTFNDYLARRDARWMGPIYETLGLRAAYVQSGMSAAARREAYAADVTYVTAKEAGFDYLRDGLRYDSAANVQRQLANAIVDEADSILIDEARVPLIIAGNTDSSSLDRSRMASIVRELIPGTDYAIDENGRNVFATTEGIERVERILEVGSLHDETHLAWLTVFQQALHAQALLQRDIDYIVKSGVIQHVDEFTGRVVPDRQWPDGLQSALEAKEGLRLGKEGTVLGSITLQHFFGLYDHISGMTATVRPESEEFWEFHGLQTVVLPTHHPCIRKDLPDRIFTHRDAKSKVVLDRIRTVHGSGRPILVGTASVRESEQLAEQLRASGLECEVLNAKLDEEEAAIIAEAGALGALTISTNMAGRGTDIRLGGAEGSDRGTVAALGGLFVLGTNRHESRRIDRQLRGRAGRQGDPGSSEFFVCLEDDLIVRYGIDGLVARRRRERTDRELEDPIVRRRIDWAQRVIQGQNFDIRRTIWDYTRFVEKQRKIMRELRRSPTGWRETDPERHRRLLEELGSVEMARVERAVVMKYVDKVWADHLAELTEIREGIHMLRIGNKAPLDEYLRAADRAFRARQDELEQLVAGVFEELDPSRIGSGLSGLDLRGPSSTWTYLVNDDPFRDILGLHVSGNIGLSLGAAMWAPLYMAIAWFKRFARKL